ncbi:MAG TPA: hypothetical protein DD856_02335 [Sulfobacillus sp.]|nr:hypothetical protein [Sulfobacillus sp.]
MTNMPKRPARLPRALLNNIAESCNDKESVGGSMNKYMVRLDDGSPLFSSFRKTGDCCEHSEREEGFI